MLNSCGDSSMFLISFFLFLLFTPDKNIHLSNERTEKSACSHNDRKNNLKRLNVFFSFFSTIYIIFVDFFIQIKFVGSAISIQSAA
jgi:hypothetical protein